MKISSILHINNIAGNPLILSRAQRKMGLKSDVLIFQALRFGYDYDFLIDTSKTPRIPLLWSSKRLLEFLTRFLPKYDVLHFHFNSILPRFADVPLWKVFRKKVIIHYRGSDIRGRRRIIPKLFADRIFVSTPDLLEYAPGAFWIPSPADLDNLPYVGCTSKSDKIRIVHAPSDKDKKGTNHVLQAVKTLESEGYNIELLVIENTPHEKALSYYREADIAVDQLIFGWYGNFAIECMALGKPVCTYIRDDLESYLPFMPVMNASPISITENLRALVQDERLRQDVGRKGREYVETMHNPLKIARKVIELYET